MIVWQGNIEAEQRPIHQHRRPTGCAPVDRYLAFAGSCGVHRRERLAIPQHKRSLAWNIPAKGWRWLVVATIALTKRSKHAFAQRKLAPHRRVGERQPVENATTKRQVFALKGIANCLVIIVTLPDLPILHLCENLCAAHALPA